MHQRNMNSLKLIFTAIILAFSISPAYAGDDFDDAKRVIFLGDSITYSGQYVAYVEAIWRLKYPNRKIEFINIGLPSETISGLSEKGHAGGRFPRPDLHERLARILDQMNPDVVVACYGMNCGIYQPYSDARFDAFRSGQHQLRDAVKKTVAKVIHVTPPTFDPYPILERTVSASQFLKPDGRGTYVGYNEVLDLYSAWLVAQRGRGWIVYDVHGPMNRFLVDARKAKPTFRLANDGVHINETGHWLMARSILHNLGFGENILEQTSVGDAITSSSKLSADQAQELIELVRKQQRIASSAWLTQTKHLRPGIAGGLPLDQAATEIKKLELQISALLKGD